MNTTQSLQVFDTALEASRQIAKEIAKNITEKNDQGKHCVLGLATGSTPKSVYQELVRIHREEGLSFKKVITFNLDEYYPMDPSAIQSYHRFMKEHLFDHIDIPEDQINVPDGQLNEHEILEYCAQYEQKIQSLGGLDIQILGIGRTGHIGFNEPGSGKKSKTRLISLDRITKLDAASDFNGAEYVPNRAITMGVGTILKARKIILMAWGEGKAEIIKKALEGPVTDQIPATFLQNHSNTAIYLDKAAASDLNAFATPWLFGPIEWTTDMVKKAVIWLCFKTQKPILKLTENDYAENGLETLLSAHNGAYAINLDVFNKIQRTITGWPGGKPGVDDHYRPERSKPMPKRTVIFSPHPDDDVISMGGTFKRLVDQGHQVHVAYQTSGNIAVFDDYVVQLIDLFDEINHSEGILDHDLSALVNLALNKRDLNQMDGEFLRNLKGLIRKVEAKAACRFVGVPVDRIHFMNLPFYETGTIKKNPLGPDDVAMTVSLLNEIKPHQIFAAGDLSDPHGTHRVCLDAINQALVQCSKESWFKSCYVWLYRGAWQEWPIEAIDMAVPLSPEEVFSKRKAIFKHQSQKDAPVFPGPDNREFWQRAEERNAHTAELYNRLGLPEYQAIEAFQRLRIENQ